jgi:ATP-dependent helicase YprA (DUF1998 family)
VADDMRDDSIEVFVHHGSVSKEEQLAAEERFARDTNACIVATSTLELGIDVGGLDLTFQANAPGTAKEGPERRREQAGRDRGEAHDLEAHLVGPRRAPAPALERPRATEGLPREGRKGREPQDGAGNR